MTKGCLKDLWTKKASSIIPFGRHCFRESMIAFANYLTTSDHKEMKPTYRRGRHFAKEARDVENLYTTLGLQKGISLRLESEEFSQCSHMFLLFSDTSTVVFKKVQTHSLGHSTLFDLFTLLALINHAVGFLCTCNVSRCKSRRNKGCLQTPGQGLDCVSHFWTFESISASSLALDRSFTQTLSATTIRQQRSVSSRSAMSGQQSGLFKLLLIKWLSRLKIGKRLAHSMVQVAADFWTDSRDSWFDPGHFTLISSPAQAYNTLLHVGMRRMYDLQLRQVPSEKNERSFSLHCEFFGSWVMGQP